MEFVPYIIASVFALAAVGVLAYVYGKNFKKVSALDLQAMPSHRQQQRKISLVEERLHRKTIGWRNNILAFVKPIWELLSGVGHDWYNRLVSLEHSYQAAAKGMIDTEDATVTSTSVITNIQAGQALLDQGQYVEAEKKFIAAISIDPRNVDAYRSLAKVYEALNDLTHAVATWQFLMQLDPKDETIYTSLGALLMQEKKYEAALEPLEQALQLNPNNPKNLDALIQAAIMNQLKYKAQSTLDKLKAVNPENQKLEKYQAEIDQL